MKIILANKHLIGMIVLPVLFSCTTLSPEIYTDHKEQPEKAVAAPTSVTTDYGKLIKVIPSAEVLFDFDSANLEPNGVQLLNYFAKELQIIQKDLVVIGYTDLLGSENYNKTLSLRRAESVKIHLISKGIDPNRIFADGRGKANPVTGNTCEGIMQREALIDCLSPDRRVEIEVSGTQ